MGGGGGGGDLSPHTSQTIYFFKTNENKTSDKEAPLDKLLNLNRAVSPYKMYRDALVKI